MGKWKNKIVVFDGIKFDSKKEASRYIELKMQQKYKLISSLTLQPEFIIFEGFRKNGKKHIEIKYIADFSYWKDGKRIIEDVKGVLTEEFRIKQKLFEFKYPELTISIKK